MARVVYSTEEERKEARRASARNYMRRRRAEGPIVLTPEQRETYRRCGREYMRRLRLENPEKILALKKTYLASDKGQEAQRAYYAKNKERMRALMKRNYYERGGQKRASDRAREKRHNWTPERVESYWQSQQGKCAICDRPMVRDGVKAGAASMHADHDHVSGHPRGLLCANCNKAIGQLQDSPKILQNAAAYLLNWGTK